MNYSRDHHILTKIKKLMQIIQQNSGGSSGEASEALLHLNQMKKERKKI